MIVFQINDQSFSPSQLLEIVVSHPALKGCDSLASFLTQCVALKSKTVCSDRCYIIHQ